MIFACTPKKEKYGKLVVLEHYFVYEIDDSYYPHDYFVEVDLQEWLDTSLFVEKRNNHLKIINKSLVGRVEFTISKNLDILNVEYDGWNYINGYETQYTVEKVILSMNVNPFESDQITGHYTLQIRETFLAEKQLKEEGVNDIVTFSTFNGKFKVYSEQEKEKGRDWIISQNELLQGIKDSLDVYDFPHERARFSFGNDSLSNLLNQFEVKRSETTEEKRSDVFFEMIIDENGKVIPESIIVKSMKSSDELIRRLRSCKSLMFNWQSAIYENKPVKSKINLPIRIKD
jgi:hypothetical protein